LLSDIHAQPAGGGALGVGSMLAGRYRIVGVLGEGGMGAVYLAEHTVLGKRVAIKVLKPDLVHDASLVERFFREARATAAIQHENIVDIIDFGQTEQYAYFAMEALEGCELADLAGNGRSVPWERAKPMIVMIARGLGAAHRLGIVHRDMKPGNVFLIRRGPANEFVKILDFGIAKIDDGAKLTRAGMVFGTAAYMAPEQAAGGEVDGRTDLYALGCIVFEMLTGRVPFPGDNFMKVIAAHISERPPTLREVAPQLPVPAHLIDGVEAIVGKMLGKFPDDRYADMAELERAILQLDPSLPSWLDQAPPMPAQLYGQAAPGPASAPQPTMILDAPPVAMPSLPGLSADAIAAAVRWLSPIAYLFVAFAHGTDGVLTTEEMRTLADRLRRWAPQIGLDGIGYVLRDAVTHYRNTAAQPAVLAQVRSTLTGTLAPAQRMQVVNDLREIASADGRISEAEQRFVSETARAFGLAGDQRLEALAFMYLALGSATTGAVAATEMKVLGEQLKQWAPGASIAETGSALRTAVDEFKRLAGPEARLDRARLAAASLRSSTDAETLRRVLADLWRIAGADGHISTQEQQFIMEMVARFN
jgi:uncharacterized tellurite resistance protein B-like protein/tRNA A-37 threonylcarbamoyl transferase component Bud32